MKGGLDGFSSTPWLSCWACDSKCHVQKSKGVIWAERKTCGLPGCRIRITHLQNQLCEAVAPTSHFLTENLQYLSIAKSTRSMRQNRKDCKFRERLPSRFHLHKRSSHMKQNHTWMQTKKSQRCVLFFVSCMLCFVWCVLWVLSVAHIWMYDIFMYIYIYMHINTYNYTC